MPLPFPLRVRARPESWPWTGPRAAGLESKVPAGSGGVARRDGCLPRTEERENKKKGEVRIRGSLRKGGGRGEKRELVKKNSYSKNQF